MSTIKRGLTFAKQRGLYSFAFLATLAIFMSMVTGKTSNLQSSLRVDNESKSHGKRNNLKAATAADFNLTNGVIYL
jgi:hypothetical protein